MWQQTLPRCALQTDKLLSVKWFGICGRIVQAIKRLCPTFVMRDVVAEKQHCTHTSKKMVRRSK
jgi:hypothetical protein